MELVRLDKQLHIGSEIKIVKKNGDYFKGIVTLSSRNSAYVYISFGGGFTGNRDILENIDNRTVWEKYMSDIVGYEVGGGWPEVANLGDLQKVLDVLEKDYKVRIEYD